MYSRLSLDEHLYMTDISVKQTFQVGCRVFYSLYLTLYQTDISLRWTFSVGPKSVCLGEIDCTCTRCSLGIRDQGILCLLRRILRLTFGSL